MKFLFWNVNRKPLEDLVGKLALEHQVDCVMLAESEMTDAAVLSKLNVGHSLYSGIGLTRSVVAVYSAWPPQFFKPAFDADRASIFRLVDPLRPEIIVAVAHLPSKLHRGDEDQRAYAERLHRQIEEVEMVAGHRRTILAGDLNMNPFELGVAASTGLHGVMTRTIAARRERSVAGARRGFFYNPMWGLFGDRTTGPPGTYYYAKVGC